MLNCWIVHANTYRPIQPAANEQINQLNNQIAQKESHKPNNGFQSSHQLTSQHIKMERQNVELQAMVQELERRLQAVTENFRQARSHHEREIQVQKSNSDKLEIQARESGTLAQQYQQQAQEKTGNVEQLTQHATQLQQSAMQLQAQLQAKDQQLQMYLQDAQRAAQGNPVLHEAHVGRVLRMKVVELEEALGGRNRIIEMLQQEISSRETNLSQVTQMLHDQHAQLSSVVEGKQVLDQKLQFEQATRGQERSQFELQVEQLSEEARLSGKKNQEQIDQKQREFDEKISETMKQLDLVQKQNETLEAANTEFEQQLNEANDELEKSRIQCAKLQQDLAETTQILQQQLNKATENLSREFGDKQKEWAEERKRLDNAVQALTNEKFDVEQTLKKHQTAFNETTHEYQKREKELTDSILAHQAELEKTQKQSIELAESLRLIQDDMNVKAASWGNEKRNVEEAIKAANVDIEARNRDVELEKTGWDSSRRNYENQVAILTQQNEELTKTLDELDKMTSEEREQLQTALLATGKEAAVTNDKLTKHVEQLTKSNIDLEFEKEQLERNWSDRFVQFESEWGDRLNKSQRNTNMAKTEGSRTAEDFERRIELLQNGFKEEKTSMEARIKQLQAEIGRERDQQDKARDEARQVRIEVEQMTGKNESLTRTLQREKKQLEEEKTETMKLREKEREQFLAERAQLENYLRSVSEHVKALQDSSNQNSDRFTAEREKFEGEIEQTKIDGKQKELELRKERDDLQVEQVRLKTQLKKAIETQQEEEQLLNDKITRLEKARSDLEGEIEQVAKQKNMFEQMIGELNEDLQVHDKKTSSEKIEWGHAKAMLDENIKNKSTQIEELMSQLANSSTTANMKEQTIDTLRKELDAMKSEKAAEESAHQARLEQLVKGHDQLLLTVQSENDQKLSQLGSMLTETQSTMKTQVETVAQEKKRLQNEKQSDKNAFDNYYQTLQNKLTELNNQIIQKEAKLVEVEAECEKLRIDLMQAVGSCQQVTEQLKNTHAQAEIELSARDEKIQQLESQLTGEQSSHHETKSARDQLKFELEQMHAQWQMHEQQLKISSSQIQGQMAHLAEETSSKEQTIGALQKETVSFKSAIEESNRVVNQLKQVKPIIKKGHAFEAKKNRTMWPVW